jgi:hypothetical protein
MYIIQIDGIIMAQSPLSFTPLANSLLLQSHFSLTYLETLLVVIGSPPPWSQVACKLTSPFPSPPHSLPIPNSQHPRFNCAPYYDGIVITASHGPEQETYLSPTS